MKKPTVILFSDPGTGERVLLENSTMYTLKRIRTKIRGRNKPDRSSKNKIIVSPEEKKIEKKMQKSVQS